MWSDCLLDLGTDFLVGNMVLQMTNVRAGNGSMTPYKRSGKLSRGEARGSLPEHRETGDSVTIVPSGASADWPSTWMSGARPTKPPPKKKQTTRHHFARQLIQVVLLQTSASVRDTCHIVL